MSSTPPEQAPDAVDLPEAPVTGVASVDAVLVDVSALGRLDPETGELPDVADHVGVFESAHSRLRRALDADPDAPVWTGPRPDVTAATEG
ncbi:hypothetical protein [Nocardioides sp. GY 10127]|uniref:hypothetical protein n=1 Tax=Nocardioides sp. GY 10127 TaxID=2569762 RepID=UPI0010A85C1B|nr:hypothetical protein [Nocardioides sp. GY 10127]TIC86345.1 hypothetical protein E8D37_00020 [Nocardioides sp. GY 10127]